LTATSPLSPTATGIRLRLHVQPKASRYALAGVHGDALKVRVTAPPVEGAANQALVRFLAEQLQVPPRAVRVESGARGRSKVVTVEGVELEVARRRLGL
jgi:hypothetical protein